MKVLGIVGAILGVILAIAFVILIFMLFVFGGQWVYSNFGLGGLVGAAVFLFGSMNFTVSVVQ